jgi:hypothetical protein
LFHGRGFGIFGEDAPKLFLAAEIGNPLSCGFKNIIQGILCPAILKKRGGKYIPFKDTGTQRPSFKD